MFNQSHVGRIVSAPSYGVGHITGFKPHESKSESLGIVTVNFTTVPTEDIEGFDESLGCSKANLAEIQFWATGHAVVGGGPFPSLSFFSRRYKAVTSGGPEPGTIGLCEDKGGVSLCVYVSQEWDAGNELVYSRVIMANECEASTSVAHYFQPIGSQAIIAERLKHLVELAKGIADGTIDDVADDLPF